jgi:hypothetical protein
MMGFNAIRFTYLTVCRGRIAIKNRTVGSCLRCIRVGCGYKRGFECVSTVHGVDIVLQLANQAADALFYEHEVKDEVAITALTARIEDPRLSKIVRAYWLMTTVSQLTLSVAVVCSCF